MQWFSFKSTKTTAPLQTRSYPISFPTRCLQIISGVQDSESNNSDSTAKGYWVNMMAARVNSFDRYGIIITRADSSTRQMYLAFGI